MNKYVKAHLVASVGTVIAAFLLFYFTLPALSFHNKGLPFLIALLAGIYFILYSIIRMKRFDVRSGAPVDVKKLFKILAIGSGSLIVLMLLLSAISSTLFNA